MRFVISRTSLASRSHDESDRPTDAAEFMNIIETDSRCCTEEEYNDRKLGGDKKWRDEGENHRAIFDDFNSESPALIAREMPEQDWVIDIPDLKSLIDLIKKEGRLVIGEFAVDHIAEKAGMLYEIEIYDKDGTNVDG